MQFKYAQLGQEYSKLHPKLLIVGEGLTEYCFKQKLPEPVATHILRTRAQQIDIYWRNIMMARKCTEQEAKLLAAKQDTWHFYFAAMDLRDFIYTQNQITQLLGYLKGTLCAGPEWELLYHDVGRGNHFHIGIRDTQWRAVHSVQE